LPAPINGATAGRMPTTKRLELKTVRCPNRYRTAAAFSLLTSVGVSSKKTAFWKISEPSKVKGYEES